MKHILLYSYLGLEVGEYFFIIVFNAELSPEFHSASYVVIKM
jgi:hypothetical protein